MTWRQALAGIGLGALWAMPAWAFTLTAADRAVIERDIRARLKDPDSARFGTMKAGLSGNVVYVCGFVNAKNSYGGYTGMSPFFGVLVRAGSSYRAFSLTGIGRGPSDDDIIVGMCAQRGISLQGP